MNANSTTSQHEQGERGQSLLVVSISLAAVVLLATGVVMASLAVFTSFAMDDPEKSSAISEWVDTTDGFSHAMEDAITYPAATPSLGAVVGNQPYLVDAADGYTVVQTDPQ